MVVVDGEVVVRRREEDHRSCQLFECPFHRGQPNSDIIRGCYHVIDAVLGDLGVWLMLPFRTRKHHLKLDDDRCKLHGREKVWIQSVYSYWH